MVYGLLRMFHPITSAKLLQQKIFEQYLCSDEPVVCITTIIHFFLALQIFCIYQAYKHNREYHWYLIILFLPLVGCLIYLYVEFYSRRNLEKVTDTIQNTISTDNRLKKLLRELEFSDTIKNRLAVGDEYMFLGESEKALEYYQSCLKGPHTDDFEILAKVLQAAYTLKNYQRVLQLAEKLKADINWHKSGERVAYAYSLYRLGNESEALAEFEDMDVQYSNYEQRMEYALFLGEKGERDAAKSKLAELLREFDNMDRNEKRFKTEVIKRVKKAYSGLR